MKGAITNYENTFYLDGAALSGIVSVDGSYNLDYQPINVIGKGFVKQINASVPKANLSIDRYLINNDPVFGLTGNGPNNVAQSVSGGLYYKNKYFAFKSGYLNSFGISCNVGEVPQIKSSFDIYGDLGSGINPSGDINGGGVFVPQVKNITLSCKNSTTNRVKSFNIDFDCPNMPIYALSNINAEIPVEVHNIFPITVNSSFVLDVDNYETKNIFDDLKSDGTTSFNIRVSGTILKDTPLTISSGNFEELTISSGTLEPLYAFLKSQDSTPIFNFTGVNAIILSEELSSSAEDLMSVKLSYRTYLN